MYICGYLLGCLGRTHDELDDLVRKLVPGSGFVCRPGLPFDVHKDCYMVIHYHSNV